MEDLTVIIVTTLLCFTLGWSVWFVTQAIERHTTNTMLSSTMSRTIGEVMKVVREVLYTPSAPRSRVTTMNTSV